MTAANHAYGAIKQRLATHVWNPGERLPSLLGLSKLAGVSRTTMWHALKQLQADSLVHVTQGRMIFVGPVQTVPDDAVPAGCAWERLQRSIGQDVLSGLYGEKRLPPQSKLALAYGVASNTLKRALSALVDEGLLARQGCGYRARLPRPRTHQAAIVFISEGNRQSGVDTGHLRTQQIIESIERECMRHGMGSRSEPFDPRRANGFMEISSALRRIPNVAGFLVNFWYPETGVLRQRWLDLFVFLTRTGVPAIVLDQAGTTKFPATLLRHGNLRVLQLAGVRAGEQVGDFLLRRGHTHVAYISSFHATGWSQARYHGICRHFRRYGGPRSRVELFAHHQTIGVGDLTLAMLNIDGEGLRRLFRTQYTAEEMRETQERRMRLSRLGLVKELRASPAAELVHETAVFMARLRKPENSRDAYTLLLERLLQVASTFALKVHHPVHFPDVLDVFSGTAWIASDDNAAISAMTFLRDRGKNIPKDISVVGFDNWLAAYQNDLTSFDFNMRGMVMQALLMITDSREMRRAPAVGEVDGYVVERRSSRAVR